jgi:hypothetical protein
MAKIIGTFKKLLHWNAIEETTIKLQIGLEQGILWGN